MTQSGRVARVFFHVATFITVALILMFYTTQNVLGKTFESEQSLHSKSKRHSTHVTLHRTRHGVVHVKASDYHGIGYGVAYAYTQDNRCLLAHRIAEVNGRLSEQLGADAPVRSEVHDITYTALQSDHYFRGWFDIEKIRAGFAAGASEVRQMAQGYADGVNRYLAEHRAGQPMPVEPDGGIGDGAGPIPVGPDEGKKEGDSRPESSTANNDAGQRGSVCPVAFKGKVTTDDVYRMWVATATVASGELVTSLLPHGAPPVSLAGQTASVSKTQKAQRLAKTPQPQKRLGASLGAIGSNAWAIGREGTRRGQSLHFYNPHFPWAGIQRLYMVHVTLPRKLDVMGPTLGGFPIPVSGFTRKVAWGLTFSPAARWSLAELALEGDPMTYKVDGVTKQITSETLSIPVRDEPTPRQIPFYRAEEGPLLDSDPFFFGWWDDPNNPGRAYAAHDVNADNTRIVEQFLRIAQANNVHELRDQLAAIQGVPWSYVIASDLKGEVFFGDISAVPGLSTEDIQRCVVSAVGVSLIQHGIVVLDGTRSDCSWSERMAAADQPQIFRSDYVANSNNTYEIPHLAERLSGFSPVLAAEGAGLSLRANLGLHMITDRLTGADGLGRPGFNLWNSRKVFFQARNRGGELLVDEIVADCQANPNGEHDGNTVDLSQVCAALRGWDRRNKTRSRGAAVFRGLWMAVRDAGVSFDALFHIPASLDQPLNTPSGYTADPEVRIAVRNALARVAVTLAEKGIPPNVRWGEVNKVLTPSGTFAMPGGFATEGLFDSIFSTDAFYTFDGWSSTLDGNIADHLYGTSYMHAVMLGKRGPRAVGLMPYSQVTDPASPWHLDQVKRWSRNRWFRLPFTHRQIASDPAHTVLKLSRH